MSQSLPPLKYATASRPSFLAVRNRIVFRFNFFQLKMSRTRHRRNWIVLFFLNLSFIKHYMAYSNATGDQEPFLTYSLTTFIIPSFFFFCATAKVTFLVGSAYISSFYQITYKLSHSLIFYKPIKNLREKLILSSSENIQSIFFISYEKYLNCLMSNRRFDMFIFSK